MKKQFLTLSLGLVLITSSAFANTGKVFVDVNGLVCDFCARALEKVFSKQDAVSDIDVNLNTKVITINFKEGQTLANEEITKLITDAGYNVENIRETAEKGGE